MKTLLPLFLLLGSMNSHAAAICQTICARSANPEACLARCCDGSSDTPGCQAPSSHPPSGPPFEVEVSARVRWESGACEESDRRQAIAQSRYEATRSARLQCADGTVTVVGAWDDQTRCFYGLRAERLGFDSESSAVFTCRPH